MTGPYIWHRALCQLIKALPLGKEAGWISDMQIASASSGASLLISSDLESNPQQLQQALAMLVGSWRNSPSPCPELKEEGSAVKAASESSRRIRHKSGLPWVSAAGAADVQRTTHVTSSPAREGTQPGQAVPPLCSQAHTAASTSQPGEGRGTGISGLSCPCRCSALR